ncbi:unnamed protein product [Xylocopa violacea]|uniref:Uncharacterized protein n=1 Tax=Xylocopa violacea TaxID=135666 RepID=A0ABP1N7Z6_XYLVO
MCVLFHKIRYQLCEYMKLSSSAKTTKFVLIERMKNKYSRIFLFYVVLAAAGFIVAIENQSDVAAISNERIQDSSSALHQDDSGSDILSTSTEKKILIEQNIAEDVKNLSKRQAINSLSDILSGTPQLNLSLVEMLESYSCETEALKFGHHHVCGILAHEFFCELNKLLHYIFIGAENLDSEFRLIFNITEDMISFTEIISSGLLPEIIEISVVTIEDFISDPNNLKMISDAIRKCVPISGILKTVTRLGNAIIKFFVHIHQLFAYLDFPSIIQNFKEFAEQIYSVKEKISSLFYRYVLNPIEEVTNVFFETITWALLISNNLTTYIQQKLYRYIAVFEEIADILRAFYNGYCASGFSQTIIAVIFSTNVSPESLPITKEFSSANNWISSIVVTSSPPKNSVPGLISNLEQRILPTSVTTTLSPQSNDPDLISDIAQKIIPASVEKNQSPFSKPVIIARLLIPM